jgi:hypothetical protein
MPISIDEWFGILDHSNTRPWGEATPLEYQTYKDGFEKKKIDMLLEHWQYNFVINLEKGTRPPFEPIYSLFQNELTMF